MLAIVVCQPMTSLNAALNVCGYYIVIVEFSTFLFNRR